MANGIDFQPVTPVVAPPPPPPEEPPPPPAPIDFQPVPAAPPTPPAPTIQPSAVSVEKGIPRTPSKEEVIARIKSGQQDYTFGPGSPGATQEDLQTVIGGKHSPASGFAVHGGVALAPSEYNLFTPEERRQLGIMDVAPEDQKGKVERYYGAEAGGKRQSFQAAAPKNIAGAQYLEGLTPSFKEKIERWSDYVQKQTGYTPKIISGHRSIEEQTKLYERHKRGGPLAAPPGRSYHNYGSATDISFVAPNGKTITDEENADLFRAMHKSAEAFGIKGIGENDLPHFQDADYAKVSDIPQGVRQAPPVGSVAVVGEPPSGEEIRARIAEISEASGVTAAKGKGVPFNWKPPPPPKKIPVAAPPPQADTSLDASGIVKAKPAAPGDTPAVLGAPYPALDFQPMAAAPGVVTPSGAGVIEAPGVAPPFLAAPEGPFPKATPVAPVGIVGPSGEPFATAPDQTYPVPQPAVPGNIDINNRPAVQNPDGSVSTELSFSIGTDKGEVLIPQVVNGRVVSQDEAIKNYQETGQHLGIFKTPAEADAYAGALHQRGGVGVAPQPASSLDFQPVSAPAELQMPRGEIPRFEKQTVEVPSVAPLYPEGSPEHGLMMRARAGDLSRPPGAFARESTIEEAVALGLPRVVPGDLRQPTETEAERLGAVPPAPTQLTEAERLGAVPAPGGPPLAPPGTDPRSIAEAYDQGGVLGALFGNLPVAKISPELLGVVAHHVYPNAAAAVTQMEKLFPATKPAVEGLTASAAETLTGLTTPSNILILGGMMLAPQIGLPAWTSRAASLGFSVQAAHGVYENAKQLTEQPGSAEWWKSFGNVVVNTAFAVTAGKHGLKGAKAVLEPAQWQRTNAIGELQRQLDRGNISVETYKNRLAAVEGRALKPSSVEDLQRASGLTKEDATKISELQGQLARGDITADQYREQARGILAGPPKELSPEQQALVDKTNAALAAATAKVPAGEPAPKEPSQAPATGERAPAGPPAEIKELEEKARRERDPAKLATLRQEIADLQGKAAPTRPTVAPPEKTPDLVLTPETVEATLPADLKGAKPRYNYGSKSFELEFESDLDKASYIAAQATKSRADARYVKFAMDATGLSEAEIRSRGQEVRTRIKAQAATAEPGRLRIGREGPAPEPGAPPVSEKPAPSADVAGTHPDAIKAKLRGEPEIVKQIDRIVARGAERKAKAKDPAIVAQRPTEYDWLTRDELARIEALKAKLPTAGERKVAAQEAVKEKRKARLATETAEEIKARVEHEKEMQDQLEAVGSESGPEFLEAVIAGGGLPAKGSKARIPWKGELDILEETVDQAIREGKLPASAKKKLFREDAPDLDRLASDLQQYGFDLARDTDVIDIMHNRIATDKPHYGTPGKGEAPEMYGMGAAHINEPLASYEKRAFGERLKQDKALAEQLREKIGSYYEPISNKVTLEEAVSEVDKMPITQAVDQVLHNERLPFHVRSAMGQLLIKRLNAAHETLSKAGDQVAADRVLDQAVDLAGWAEEFGTRLGQGVQSFAMWSRLTPEGQLRSVKNKVDEARRNYTDDHKAEIDALKAKILELQKLQLTDAERLAELKKLFGRNPTAKRVKPYLQKLLDATRSGKFSDEIFYNIVSDRLGLPKFDPETARQITALSFEVARAPEGLPKDKAVLRLQHYIATKMGFSPKDLPLGIWYGNMLSGYNTQIVNFVDTLVNVVSETIGLSLVNPKAAGKIYANLFKGLAEGTTDALVVWNNGRIRGTAGKYLEMPNLMEVAEFGKKGGVPLVTKGPIARGAKWLAETKPAALLGGWKYVGRLMMSSDSIMFRGARQAKAAALADYAARQEGLRGDALNKRVREMLGQTAEQYADFAEQAKAEGFKGAEKAARIMELRDRVQSRGAAADAEDFAGIATYNHMPRGFLGKVATVTGQISNVAWPVKLIVPFTRIVANVTNRSLNYSPFGFKRALYGYTFDKAPLKLPASELPALIRKRAAGYGELTSQERTVWDDRVMHFTRATLGTTGLMGAWAMQEAGFIEIHGNGPKDAEKRRQQMEAGWKPYSFKLAGMDHYFSYLPTPLAISFGILGNWSDSHRYHELDNKHGATAAVWALARTANVISSQSFLSGLSSFFNMVSSNPDQAVASWRNFVAQTASSVFPRIALDIGRVFDPTKYSSDEIYQDIMRNTPFASLTNNAALNAFGEVTTLPRQRIVTEISKDMAWQIVLNQELRVPVPGKGTKVPDGRGGERQLTPEEYYKLLEETGPRVKQWILTHGHLDPTEAQDQLDKAAAEIRAPALDRIKRSARWNPID